MKRGSILVLLTIFVFSGAAWAEEHGRGYVQGVDLSNIEEVRDLVGWEVPRGTQFDWRANPGNWLPAVENQSTTGWCWAFGALHGLEAMINIDAGSVIAPDFSEDAMAECTLPGTSGGGGNFWKAGGYLSAMGPVLESCQPFNPVSNGCLACDQQDYRMRKVITIANSVTEIKAALTNGPVGTSMDSSGGTAQNFDLYDGTYVLTNGSPSGTDHCVLIVGWHEGTAGSGYLAGDYWIVKNSWGTGWGDGGFFYIEYGAANIGSNCFQITEWEDSLATQAAVLNYEDDNGPDGSIVPSPATNNLYICQRIIPSITGDLESIQWANAGNNFNWQINVYDNMSGSYPSTLMGSWSGTNEPFGGILTYDLPTPISVTSGNAIYICIRLNNPTGTEFPIDLSGTYSGYAYVSTSAITGPYTNMSSLFPRDFCVRAKITNPNADVPATTPLGIGLLLAGMGYLVIRRRK